MDTGNERLTFGTGFPLSMFYLRFNCSSQRLGPPCTRHEWIASQTRINQSVLAQSSGHRVEVPYCYADASHDKEDSGWDVRRQTLKEEGQERKQTNNSQYQCRQNCSPKGRPRSAYKGCVDCMGRHRRRGLSIGTNQGRHQYKRKREEEESITNSAKYQAPMTLEHDILIIPLATPQLQSQTPTAPKIAQLAHP